MPATVLRHTHVQLLDMEHSAPERWVLAQELQQHGQFLNPACTAHYKLQINMAPKSGFEMCFAIGPQLSAGSPNQNTSWNQDKANSPPFHFDWFRKVPGAGLSAGTVAHGNGSAPTPFNPTGYAFRNTSTSLAGITHVVVWDALPVMQDANRVTRCNVTVTLATHLDAAASEPTSSKTSAVASVSEPSASDVRLVVLGNGSVYEQDSAVFPLPYLAADVPLPPIRFELDLYDAPILVARGDALPGYMPSH